MDWYVFFCGTVIVKGEYREDAEQSAWDLIQRQPRDFLWVEETNPADGSSHDDDA